MLSINAISALTLQNVEMGDCAFGWIGVYSRFINNPGNLLGNLIQLKFYDEGMCCSVSILYEDLK